MRRSVTAALAVVLGIGVTHHAHATPPMGEQEDAVLAWNEITADATVLSGIAPLLNPLHESRIYAMVHIAVHDALNGIERRSRPYAVDLRLLPNATPDAAVATAAHDVLVSALGELPAEFEAGIQPAIDHVDEQYTAGPRRRSRTAPANGRAWPSAGPTAAVVVADRADDGADTPFIDTTTDPDSRDQRARSSGSRALRSTFAPGWGDVTPFVMTSGAQYRPPPPHDLEGRRYAEDFNELKSLGSLTQHDPLP